MGVQAYGGIEVGATRTSAHYRV